MSGNYGTMRGLLAPNLSVLGYPRTTAERVRGSENSSSARLKPLDPERSQLTLYQKPLRLILKGLEILLRRRLTDLLRLRGAN